ncbi:MAG: ABC transporter permease [Acidaminococcales bacterium]|nr:ABC transporter permease [Acidaminococcales bacterium]
MSKIFPDISRSLPLNDFKDKLAALSGLVGFFLLWEIAPRLGVIDEQFIPPVSAVLAAMAKMTGGGELFVHIAASVQRTLIGIFLATIIAIPAGFILGGAFPAATLFLRPLTRILGQINAFCLFPIFILFFGIGELSKISIIFWSTIWPIFSTTVAGVRQIDPLYIKIARSMGTGKLSIFYKVIMPGAAPVIFTGVRAGANLAFLMLIAAELIGAKAGLGWLIKNSTENFIIPRLFAAALLIAVLGMLANYLITYAEKTLISWKQEQSND